MSFSGGFSHLNMVLIFYWIQEDAKLAAAIKKEEEEAAATAATTNTDVPTETEDVVDAKEAAEVAVIESSEEKKDEATSTVDDEQTFAVGTSTEEDIPIVEETPALPPVDFKEVVHQFITKLLRALHVYERYKDVTSKQLPDTVDFFGKTLLGLTSITSFQDTLNNSLRVANFFLHVSDTTIIIIITIVFTRLSNPPNLGFDS